jgi:hypothetical protein
MCPRCRRRARTGKPLDCAECEAAVQRDATGDGGDAQVAVDGTGESSPGLAVNDPDDRYEREAEAVAERVVRTSTAAPAPGADRESAPAVGPDRGASGVQRMCARCSTRLAAGKPLDCPECEAQLQRKAARGPGDRPASRGDAGDISERVEAASGGGRPLPARTRRTLEPRFGYDFGDVRVHTGPRADALARALDARAFTRGGDVFFARGEYRPATEAGRRLLAHELTHTIQQGAVDSPLRESRGGSASPDGGGDRPARATTGEQSQPATPMPGPPAPGLQRAARPDSPDGSRQSAEPTTATRPAEREQTWSEWGWETGREVVEWGEETGREAVEAGGEATQAISEYGESVVVTVGDTAAEVASGVWSTVQSLAAALGGDLRWVDGSIVIAVSDRSLPVDPPAVRADPPAMGFTFPFLRGGVSLGMVTLTGTASLSTEFDPAVTMDVGTPTVERYRLEVDPLGGAVSSRGRVTLPTRLGLDARLSAGVGGDLRAVVVLPTEPPIPVPFPSVGLTGGLAGHGSTTARTDLALEGSAAGALGNVALDMDATGRSAVDTAVGLSGWEAVEFEGFELCRQHWPLWSKRLRATLTAGAGLSLSAGTDGFGVVPRLSPPEVTDVELSDLPAEAVRNLVPEECRLCELFRNRDWFASPDQLAPFYMQRGDRLAGPLEAYPHHPAADLPPERARLFQQDTLCRGACGWDCTTCDYREQLQVPGYDAAGRRVMWTYHGVHVCSTHPACREHDACFDWAARGGETGMAGALLGKNHWICNIKCYCDYSATQCAGFIGGAGGTDTMYFVENPPAPEPADDREDAPDLPGPDDPNLGGRDGTSPSSALPFKLHKPWRRYQLYARTLELPGAHGTPGRGGTSPVTVHRGDGPIAVRYPAPDGTGERVDEFGVSPEYWPREGQLLQFNPGRQDRERRRWRTTVEALGADLSGLQADHVRELQFGDEAVLDRFDNLWPMDERANQSAGSLHRREFGYYEAIFGSLRNRWFEITEVDIGAPYLPAELYR